MTEALYQNDSYCREFRAHVTAQDADQGAIQLNRTVFYPGGGGQPYDVGRLWVGEQAVEVRRVHRGIGTRWRRARNCPLWAKLCVARSIGRAATP